jgi:hypothetical protein
MRRAAGGQITQGRCRNGSMELRLVEKGLARLAKPPLLMTFAICRRA